MVTSYGEVLASTVLLSTYLILHTLTYTGLTYFDCHFENFDISATKAMLMDYFFIYLYLSSVVRNSRENR